MTQSASKSCATCWCLARPRGCSLSHGSDDRTGRHGASSKATGPNSERPGGRQALHCLVSRIHGTDGEHGHGPRIVHGRAFAGNTNRSVASEGVFGRKRPHVVEASCGQVCGSRFPLDGNPGLTSSDPLGCSAGRRQSIPLEAPCHARVLSVPSTIYALRSALAPLLTLEAAMRDLAVEAYSQGNLAFK